MQTNFMAYFRKKKLTCDVDVEENLEVYGDPDKLARVFDNILRNAIAYCYENTKIEIQARMKNNKIEITFTNSGDGFREICCRRFLKILR